MESFSQATEYAEFIIQKVKQNPESYISQETNSGNRSKSIHQKLTDLYLEEKAKETEESDQVFATNLLAKLVKKEKLECLILNLYPGSEGYSLIIRGRNGVETETLKLPYEAAEFLEYVDASELPPFLVDLLDRAQVNVFYSGCVILEVRDYRRTGDGNRYETDYVLLRPTPQSLLADIYNLSSDGHRWTQDDLFTLESQLLLATEEPICLDPSPAVHLVANKLQYEAKILDTPMIKRSLKKYSQASINRKRKFEHAPAPKELRLYDFLHKKRHRSQPPINLKVGKAHVDMWKQKPVQLAIPETVEVENYATVIEPPENVSDNDTDLVEEQILERGTNQEKKLLAKLSILKRRSDHVYYGELYIDHDHKEGSQGSSCNFLLGSRGNVDKYVQQFKEIFTEEGRLAVKITKQVPGQAPVIEYTQTSSTSSGITISGAQAVLGTHHISSSTSGADQSLLMPKRNVPIQLSLTLAPAGSNAQTGNQLQLNIQKQPISTQSQFSGQRNKFSTSSSSSQRSASNTPSQSPATTPTSNVVQSQLFPHLLSNTSKSQLNISSPSHTPATNPASVSRRSSLPGSEVTGQGQINQQQSGIAFVQSGDSNQGQTTPSQNVTNINFGGLAPNINIQNLTGLSGINIANLQSLQNMQVSAIPAGSIPGGIAVPITLVTSSAGVIPNQTGIFVSSLPNLVSMATTANSNVSTAHVSQTNISSTAPSIVTFVTTLPSTVSSTVNTSSAVSASATATVAPTGVLSLPMASLAPLVSSVRTQAVSGIRASTLPLLQIQGQPGSLQLVNLQQQRAPMKPGTATLAAQPPGQVHMAAKSTSSIPNTGVLTAQSVPSGHQVTLSQIKPGQTTSVGGQIPQQQLIMQQLHRQQFQIQPFQQVRPQTTTANQMQANAKAKNKKRTTPTPPKH